MYFIRTPKIASLLFPEVMWRGPGSDNEIFLTFDDGPEAEVTPWLLDTLDQFDSKASFFIVGRNAKKQPALVNEIISRGHAIGNHSYSHVDAFKVSANEYLEDVKRGKETIEGITGRSLELFRPPYGRLTRRLYRDLRSEYKIVMWSLMPGDFDDRKKEDQVLDRCIQHTRTGSIVVLHDSQKAQKHLRFLLPPFLEELKKNNFRMNFLA